MIKAIFFDLDGTLLDTLEDIRVCLNETLLLFGRQPVTKEETRLFVGNGAKKLVERALKGDFSRFDEILADYKYRFARCDNSHTRLYDGEAELLDKLRGKVRLCVITNKPQDAAEKVLADKFDFTFDYVGGDSGKYPVKPDPAQTLAAMRSFSLTPEECLFVGDGETDFLTGRNAGMNTVSCLWGFRTQEVLESYGANLFAENYAQLGKIFTEKFGIFF